MNEGQYTAHPSEVRLSLSLLRMFWLTYDCVIAPAGADFAARQLLVRRSHSLRHLLRCLLLTLCYRPCLTAASPTYVCESLGETDASSC